jgi:hypothetical protein
MRPGGGGKAHSPRTSRMERHRYAASGRGLHHRSRRDRGAIARVSGDPVVIEVFASKVIGVVAFDVVDAQVVASCSVPNPHELEHRARTRARLEPLA